MTEPTDSSISAPAKRPKFLTVLCILSFVGIGISIVSGIISYFSYSALASAGNALSNGLGGLGNGEKAGQALNSMMGAIGLDYNKWALVALIQTALNLPILAGVLLMWKQKKLGYYIYAPVELIQPALPLIMGLGLAGGLTAIGGLVFAVTFVVLYGLNLKHMHSNGNNKPMEQTAAAPAAQKQTASAPSTAAKGNAIYEVRLSNISCIPVGATYKVGMTITAKKFAVDGTGKEKEEMINDDIQIGMVKNGKEIYLKSYKFTKTVTPLSLTLDQKPDKIGVDPYNKLPERV